MARLTWVENGFISKDLYAPFIVEHDSDYVPELENRYRKLMDQARGAGADDESIEIINKYRKRILAALRAFFKADVVKCNRIIKNLVDDVGLDSLAIAPLGESRAFPGQLGSEVQLFRSRTGPMSRPFAARDMLHLPRAKRAKSGSYRFSIPGNPSYYLANSSYGCWIETGFPTESEFNVAPVVLDGTQRIFNLAVSVRDFSGLNELDADRVHCWLKLLMLMIATSFRVDEENRSFRSEYVISQAVMIACKKLKYDGVAYYSKRVSDEIFAFCAINLALFIDYDSEYSPLVKHMKIDDPFNYSLFKQLQPSLRCKEYAFRSIENGLVTNVGNYDRQYPYRETEFFEFDKFLFASWRDKRNGKGKK